MATKASRSKLSIVSMALDLARLMEQRPKAWKSIDEWHNLFASEVDKCSPKTVDRYLVVLAEVGIAERRNHYRPDSPGNKIFREFKWVGWPSAMGET